MKKIFLRGLLGIAPIAITIIVLAWLYTELEWIFGSPIKYFFPSMYFQGIGVIFAIVILFFVGWMLNLWIIQKLYNWIEIQFKKIPLLKTIYTSVTDLMSFFNTSSDKEKKGKFVLVKLGEAKMMGIITRESFNDLPKNFGSENEVLVFFPTSYQIGGYTMMVPRSCIELIDISVEKGLRLVVTGGSPGTEKSSFSAKRPKHS